MSSRLDPAGDLATWNAYAGDTDRLKDEVDAIRTATPSAVAAAERAAAYSAELERVLTERYDFEFPGAASK